MPEEILTQVIVQFPVVVILMYLLFRLDQRMGDLIKVICTLTSETVDEATLERIERYLEP